MSENELITENSAEGIETKNAAPMSEERPFVTASVKIDGAIQKKINRPAMRLAWISLGVSIAAWLVFFAILLAHAIPALVNGEESTADVSEYTFLLIIGILVLVIFFLQLFVCRTNVKNAEKLNLTNSYAFYSAYFTVNSDRAGETMGSSKHYYKELKRTKETKELFLIYLNARSVYPIEKGSLTEEDCAKLRLLLSIK